MLETPCNFVWYDLMTTDTAAAASFYHHVIGWDARDANIPGQSYILLSMGQAVVGGLTQVTPEASARGAQPGWLGHIGVADVDACAARVVEAGGTMHRGPEDIPSIGRFAVVADPHGVTFVIFQPRAQTQSSNLADMAAQPGHVGWNELQAGDGGAAWAFYSGLFGWTKAEAIDMGPMGVYQTFAAGGLPIGAMMTKMAEIPAPCWIYYISVDGVAGASERAKMAGGRLLAGPMEVPGGSWIAQFLDPQGAMFAMVGPKG